MLYNEYRCSFCNKLLFKGILVDSEVETKCRGCGSVCTFHGEGKEKLLCFIEHCPGRKSPTTAVFKEKTSK